MNLKKEQDKSSVAPIFLIALVVVAMFATLTRLPLSVNAATVTKFVEVGYHSNNEYPFTEISCSISTSQIITPQGSCGVSDWIAIWAYDNDLSIEFIQIGIVVYSVAGIQQGPLAFWATNGNVQSTNYLAQNITSLAVGSVHAYDLSFDGTGWFLHLDGSQVAYISFPHQAYVVQVTHETKALTPADPGLVNSGITTFSNIYFKAAGTIYPFLTDFSKETWIRYFSHSFSFDITIDDGNNGLQYLSTNSLQMGWGLPTTGLYEYTVGYGTNPGTQEPFLATLLNRYWLLIVGVGVIAVVIFTVARRRKH